MPKDVDISDLLDNKPQSKDVDISDLLGEPVKKKEGSVSGSVGQDDTSKSGGFRTVETKGHKENTAPMVADKLTEQPTRQTIPHDEVREKIYEKPRSVDEFNKEFGINPDENDHKNPQMIMQPSEQEDMLGKVQSKRYVKEQSEKHNVKPEDSYWFAYGANVNKEAANILRDVDGAYRIVKNILSSTPGALGDMAKMLPEKSNADKAATAIDDLVDRVGEHYKAPDNFWGDILQSGGKLTTDLLPMMVAPEIKLKFISTATGGMLKSIPSFSTYLGVDNALSTYDKLDKEGVPEMHKIGETVKQGGLGMGTGLLWDSFGYISNKTGDLVKGVTDSNIAQRVNSVTTNAGLFGLSTAADQYVNDKISGREIAGQALQGGVLGLLGGKSPEEHIKDKQQVANDRFFTTSTEDINNINKINLPVDQIREKQIELQDKAEKETDPNKKEELQLASNNLDGYIDIKAITRQIVSDPARAIKAINDSQLLTDVEKQHYINKVHETVANNDPRIQESKPLLDEIQKTTGEIQSINANPSIPNESKPVMTEGLEGKQKDLTKQVAEVMQQPNDIYSQNKKESIDYEKSIKERVERLKKIGGQDATESREIEKNDQQEHQNRDETREKTETSRGNSSTQGEGEQEEKIAGYEPKEPEIKKEVLEEIQKLPLTHVKEKGMDITSGGSEGTYLSTEKEGNRNATSKDRVYEAKAKVEKPFVIENNDDFLDQTEKRGIKQVDESGEDRDVRDVRNDLYDKLKKEGYDAVYYREGKTQEGELYVFDRKNVKLSNKEENIENHNKLVDKLRIYKGLTNKKQKAEYVDIIRKRANDLGYKVGFDKNKGITVSDEKGNPIRQITEKRTPEQLSKERSLSEHPKDFQDFVTHMSNDFRNISQVEGIHKNEKALNDIKNNIKSASATDMLNNLKNIYDKGEIPLWTDETYKTKITVPVKEFMDKMNEISEKVNDHEFSTNDYESEEFKNDLSKIRENEKSEPRGSESEGEGNTSKRMDNEQSRKAKADKLIESIRERTERLANVPFLTGKERVDYIEDVVGLIKELGELGYLKLEEGIEKALKYLKDKHSINVPDDVKKDIEEQISPKDDDNFTTSLKRAVADAEKKEIFGTDKLEEMKNSLQDTDVKNAYESAKIKVDRGEIKPNEVTDRVIKTNTGTLEDEATLLYERGRLKNQELKLLKDRNNSEDANSKNKINDDLMKLYDKLAENDYAAAKIGREASNIFRLRKEYIDSDMSLFSMERQYMDSKGAKELTPEQKQEVKVYYDKLQEAKIRLDEVEEKLRKEKERGDMFQQLYEEAKKQRKEDRSIKIGDAIERSNQRISKSKDKLKELLIARKSQASAGLPLNVDLEIAGEIAKIATEKVYQGAKKLEEVVKGVLDEVKDIYPNWTEKDIEKYLGKYNIETPKRVMSDESKIVRQIKRTAQIKSKLEANDYSMPKRPEYKPNKELEDARAEYANLKNKWDMERYREMLERRPQFEQLIDKYLKLRTGFGLLSGIKTLGKLVNFSAVELLWRNPADILTTGISKVLLSPIAKKAMVEGQINWKAIKLANKTLLDKQTYKDAISYLTSEPHTHELYGAGKTKEAEFFLNLGRLHGAEKYALWRSTFNKYAVKYTDYFYKEGRDVKDPAMQKTIEALSAEKANQRIMMNQNVISGTLRTAQNYMYHHNFKTGYYIAKFLFPIVNVPTNMAIKQARAVGGVLEFGARISQGLEKMTPENCDKALVAFKEGLPGAGLGIMVLTTNWISMNKDKKMEIGGWEPPDWMQHHPDIQVLKLYAQAKQEYAKKNDLYSATMTIGLNTIHEIPFLDNRTIDMIGDPAKFKRWGYNAIASAFTPQLSRDIASFTDKDPLTVSTLFSQNPVKRKPKTLKEQIEIGFPGLREKVPTIEQAKENAYAEKFANEHDPNHVLDVSTLETHAKLEHSLNEAKEKEKKLRDANKSVDEIKKELGKGIDELKFAKKNANQLEEFEKVLSFYKTLPVGDQKSFKEDIENEMNKIKIAHDDNKKIDVNSIKKLDKMLKKHESQEKIIRNKILK